VLSCEKPGEVHRTCDPRISEWGNPYQ